MTLDQREHLAEPVREAVAGVVYPIQFLVDVPFNVVERISERLATRQRLIEENRSLRTQQLQYQGQLQRMASLQRENERLRNLLGSSHRVEHDVAVAQLMRTNLDPSTHLVLINRGASSGVFPGQPILDSHGVMGQVDRVGPYSAMVRLISDPSHAIPVEVNRNGIRAIALGSGNLHQLELANVPNNADIRTGDLLTASGLGGVFPRGYPVAEVITVEIEPGEPFARVYVRPVAALDRSRKVMLVLSHDPAPESPSVEAGAQAQGTETP